MNTYQDPLKNKWRCVCGGQLALSKVRVQYLSGHYQVELLKCTGCGKVLIDEELAMGKMLEVEKVLEDK